MCLCFTIYWAIVAYICVSGMSCRLSIWIVSFVGSALWTSLLARSGDSMWVQSLCLSQFTHWLPSAKVMILGEGDVGRWVGSEGGSLTKGISALIKETGGAQFSVLPCRHVETQHKLWVPSSDPRFIYWCLDLKYPALQKCKNGVLFSNFIWNAGQEIYHWPLLLALISVVFKSSSFFWIFCSSKRVTSSPRGGTIKRNHYVQLLGSLSSKNQGRYIISWEDCEGLWVKGWEKRVLPSIWPQGFSEVGSNVERLKTSQNTENKLLLIIYHYTHTHTQHTHSYTHHTISLSPQWDISINTPPPRIGGHCGRGEWKEIQLEDKEEHCEMLCSGHHDRHGYLHKTGIRSNQQDRSSCIQWLQKRCKDETEACPGEVKEGELAVVWSRCMELQTHSCTTGLICMGKATFPF